MFNKKIKFFVFIEVLKSLKLMGIEGTSSIKYVQFHYRKMNNLVHKQFFHTFVKNRKYNQL
ncbi:hypothetical protein DX930_27905 [Bacillus cereus]|nr:hypothetical protein DX930_27905 [Bacillus cereus]